MKKYVIHIKFIERSNLQFGETIPITLEEESIGKAKAKIRIMYEGNAVEIVKTFESEPCPHCGTEMLKEIIVNAKKS